MSAKEICWPEFDVTVTQDDNGEIYHLCDSFTREQLSGILNYDFSKARQAQCTKCEKLRTGLYVYGDAELNSRESLCVECRGHWKQIAHGLSWQGYCGEDGSDPNR